MGIKVVNAIIFMWLIFNLAMILEDQSEPTGIATVNKTTSADFNKKSLKHSLIIFKSWFPFGLIT